MSLVLVRAAETDADRQDCFAIRMAVFVDEQGVPLDEELDEHDQTATHFVAVVDGQAMGTLRWRVTPPATAKIERVAVRREARGLGLGGLLMYAALRGIGEAGIEAVILNAQTRATEFYCRLGFVTEGDPFDDAAIEHIRMRLAPVR